MAMNSSLFAYEDCLALLDRALADPLGCRIPCDSRDSATRLRTRIHYARKLTREANMETYEPGHPMHGRSEYDKVSVRLRDEAEGVFLYLEHVTAPTVVENLSDLSP